jgi:hypothetical protein
MEGVVKPAILVFLVPITFGIIGGVMAANRGRSFVLWAVLSLIFPVFILVIWFEKPIREVEGKFKRCSACGEWLKWQEPVCRYCRAEQLPR